MELVKVQGEFTASTETAPSNNWKDDLAGAVGDENKEMVAGAVSDELKEMSTGGSSDGFSDGTLMKTVDIA